MEILHLENVSFRYPTAAENAIDGVSLRVQSGEFVVVCGESGCGKTTLLRLLNARSRPPARAAARFITAASRSLRSPSAPRRARSAMCCKTPTTRS
ncbi:MAG: ATP-binding cassette domain-containing protein [Acutalibacteraceae bacterium]